MKRMVLVALILLALSVPARAAEWLNGVVTNPTAGTVIVDTGAFSIDANRTPCAWVAATVASITRIQWVDTDGTTVVHEQFVPAGPAVGIQQFCLPAFGPGPLMLLNQRFRIITFGVIAGSVSGSIYIPEGL